MSLPLTPYSRWESGTNQNSVPANDNSLRDEIFNTDGIADDVTAQPTLTSPADDGNWYIIPAAATGTQWATFAEDSIAIFYGGAWYEFVPAEGNKVSVLANLLIYSGSGGWEPLAPPGSGDVVGPAGATNNNIAVFDTATGKLIKDGGKTIAEISPIGLHSVPVMAGAIQPSVAGGCAALASIVSAANQPDIITLDFDPSTQEYAQFAIPMPKSWNEGTLTAEFRWSHAATTTNFGVVWNIQAVAVSNDDTIAVNFGTAQQIADTGGTTNDLYVTSQTPSLTVGGTPAAGDTVFFRVSRVTGDGSDNMAVDARLHSVVLYMTTDAATDA